MNKRLPLYELTINPEEDAIVYAIGLVESPAIERNFLAFNKVEERFNSNDEKMELLGAAMIPNEEIGRGDYNVFFSKETIRQIAQVYSKNGFQKNLNLHHSTIPAHSYIFQSYIVDTDKGINAPKGIDAPNGSWIIGVKCEDKEVWDKIKSGEVKGFSIEGIFEQIEAKMNKQNNDDDVEVMNLLQQLNRIINKQKK